MWEELKSQNLYVFMRKNKIKNIVLKIIKLCHLGSKKEEKKVY